MTASIEADLDPVAKVAKHNKAGKIKLSGLLNTYKDKGIENKKYVAFLSGWPIRVVIL